MPVYIAGISAFYHDSAACILRDGELIAAAQEERFSRIKGDARFPAHALRYCLSHAGIDGSRLDMVAYYDKPIMTFGRLLQTYLEYPLTSYRSFKVSIPKWVKEKLRIPKIIDENIPGFEGEIVFCRHHESHAASAFFTSPFEEAAIVVVDGVGEWACTSVGAGRGNSLQLLKEVRFPHSLGLFYSAMTQYLGFKVNFDEYKVMGLAPYGKPKYVDLLTSEVLDLKSDGSLSLNLEYFDFPQGLTMINGRLGELLGQPQREQGQELTQFHMDVAASVQSITTETMIRLARTARSITGLSNLCLAGGVALNCVANGIIYREGIFDNIYIQPASGDAGGAVGAALQAWHQVMGKPLHVTGRDGMSSAYLGPSVKNGEVIPYLESLGVEFLTLAVEDLPESVARWIAQGHIIGFCHGRMEFGPRALGHRSILGDPRDPDNQTRINRKVKFRESFRPFAPALLEEYAAELFDLRIPSPYMLMVMPLKPKWRKAERENAEKQAMERLHVVRSHVPAVTHVDYSVRIQTVSKTHNDVFHAIVSAFHKLTGCPMIVNTSFNVSEEPIVCDHHDAYWCFAMTDIDILVLDTCVLVKPGVDLNAPLREYPEIISR